MKIFAMKKAIICGSIVIILGMLIALGPRFLFKVCDSNMASSENTEDCCTEPAKNNCCGPAVSSFSICHWTAQAEIGLGLLIVAMGACMIVFTDIKTRLGLFIGVFMSSIIALAIPNFLIGGCSSITMQCRKIAFPALTVESIVLLVFSAITITIIVIKKPIK